jgi:uncharacterized protein DUF5946
LQRAILEGGESARGGKPATARWAVLLELIEEESGDYRYTPVHQLAVDAYMAQYPGAPSQRSIQPAHLIGLYLVLERDCGFDKATKAMQRAANRKRDFAWRDHSPRRAAGEDPAEHVERWARSVWGRGHPTT